MDAYNITVTVVLAYKLRVEAPSAHAVKERVVKMSALEIAQQGEIEDMGIYYTEPQLVTHAPPAK